MSKAFTKESDGEEPDESLEDSELRKLPVGSKNYITPRGLERLKSEWRKLLNEDRPEVVRTVSWAASNGDRSENGDYLYGKKRLREIDRRIRFLTKRIESSEVVDPVKQVSEKIVFGATVTVLDEAGKSRKFQIVGIDETNVQKGKISWISPIGKALLGQQQGDVILLKTPKGEEELEIQKVDYLEVD